VLVTESTYGNRDHVDTDPSLVLADVIQRTAHRGGAVIMPTFCVGRVQEVMLLLARLKASGGIPDLPIYLDSPMAIDATALYVRYHGEHRLDLAQAEAMSGVAHIVRTVEESKRVTAWQGPMVVLAGSGMATGGRVLHHLKAFAPDSRNTILFAGYQAVGTRGSDIVHGARSVRIHGRDVPIRAEITNLGNLSAHADATELIAWLRGMPHPPQQVYVTHGEPDASTALAARIGTELGWHANIPAMGDTVQIPER
jgi:metallo-beta-lactamase family protein